jgi:hypothetical protein
LEDFLSDTRVALGVKHRTITPMCMTR